MGACGNRAPAAQHQTVRQLGRVQAEFERELRPGLHDQHEQQSRAQGSERLLHGRLPDLRR